MCVDQGQDALPRARAGHSTMAWLALYDGMLIWNDCV
jgi:hypothetical protein